MTIGKTTQGFEFSLTDDDRMRHVHVVGQTGVGKSGLLKTMIADDLAAGHGLAVIDPHGTLAEEVLALVPPSRFHEVRYLNPADPKPAPFNPLHRVALADRPRVADEIVAGFRAVWGWTPEKAPRALPLLRNAIRTALDLPEPTFLDVMRLLDDEAKRRGATDPMNRLYWERLASRDARYQDEAVDPVLTRLDSLLGAPDVRATLCQRPTWDIESTINEGRILIANLNKGAIGEMNAHLIGAFLVSAIIQAAMHRSPQFHQRRFYLFIDEFQSFATDSFATALSEIRKFGIGLTLAHQYVRQVPETVMSAVLGNTGTTLCFRVGAEDASLLAAHTGGWVRDDLPPTILKDLPNYQCVARVLREGSPQAIRLQTLPPPVPLHDRVDQLVKNARVRFGRDRSLVERKISSFPKGKRRKLEKW